MNYEQDWQLKPRRWTVLYDDPDSGLKAGENLSVEPPPPVPAGEVHGSMKGKLGDITSKDPQFDQIKVDSDPVLRRVCLICQGRRSTDPVTWVAREETDSLTSTEARFEPDWKLEARKWTVIYPLSGSPQAGDTLQFLASNELKVNSTTTLGTCATVPAEDAVLLTPTAPMAPTVKVRRRVCLIGPPGASGGATWVAEEGG